MPADTFDPSTVLRALARANSPADVEQIVGGDPRKSALADYLHAVVAEAPPITPEQRAGIRSILRATPERRQAS